MRQNFFMRSFVTASLLLATPVFAQSVAPAAEDKAAPCEERHGRHGKRGMNGERKLARMEHRLDRAVVDGRLTQAQADQFKAEAKQLQEERKALREASGGKITEEQRQQGRERFRAFHEKVKAAMKASTPAKI
ncbi:hypothetical protein SAMN05443572_105287 [Myxococcus fulvus]|uniref:Lipoprotein n=1 Tax=Myxococcus fulvus TaxID=33 RepID=A0A511T4E2_MYXFU|nr:hypothetical protein [Myxococcus fulvus]GEN09030.1 hypothetical protein MFU01_40670 [Myxococcus fulvus]SEU14569.1 hypothetical protein SAMN05443572_105287 [Myxococcus fulvus]